MSNANVFEVYKGGTGVANIMSRLIAMVVPRLMVMFNLRDPNDGTAAGSKMTSTGVVQATRSSGASAVFLGYTQGTTAPTTRINGDGSVTFASTIQSLGSAGGYNAFSAGYGNSTADAFVVRGNGTVGTDAGGATPGNYKYKLDSNGSATFVGRVTSSDPTISFFGNPNINSGGTVFRSAVQRQAQVMNFTFTASTTGGQSASIATNGNATFPGGITGDVRRVLQTTQDHTLLLVLQKLL